MADRIVALTKSDTQWDISYEVEKNSLTNSFCVRILKADMTDPEAEAEARSLANVQAAAIKDAWAAEAPTEVQLLSEPEEVTL